MVGFFFCFVMLPPVWFFFSLPIEFRMNKIPVVKFMSYLTSHIYFVLFLSLTCVLPPHTTFRYRIFSKTKIYSLGVPKNLWDMSGWRRWTWHGDLWYILNHFQTISKICVIHDFDKFAIILSWLSSSTSMGVSMTSNGSVYYRYSTKSKSCKFH